MFIFFIEQFLMSLQTGDLQFNVNRKLTLEILRTGAKAVITIKLIMMIKCEFLQKILKIIYCF